MVRNSPILFSMVRYNPIWSDMVQYDLILFAMVDLSLELTVTFTHKSFYNSPVLVVLPITRV